MFRINAKDVAMFKQAVAVLKTDIVNIRANKEKGTVIFSFHNRNTGLLLLHKVKAHVERDQEFGIGSDRLTALLSKDNLEFDFNGSSVTYKSGRSRGNVETHKPYFEAWPNLQQTGVPVQEVLDEFSFLNLKSKNARIYIFGGTDEGQPVVIAGDREHFVYMPLQKSSEFSLPLDTLQGAQRIFKEKVRVIVDNGTVYFQARTDTYTALLRFGQLGDMDVLSLKTLSELRHMPAVWSTVLDIQVFKNILSDYEAIKDNDRVGLITVTADEKSINLSSKTRHGEVAVTEAAKGDKLDKPFLLNVELLKDIVKLEGPVTVGLKGERVFFIQNEKACYLSGLGG